MRFHNHAEDAHRAFEMAEKYAVTEQISSSDDLEFLDACEERDGIFDAELDALWE